MTPFELPALASACTLPGAELPARLRAIAALGEDALLDSTVTPGRATLRFAARHGIRERLDAIVAAESACCGFLTFAVSADGGDSVVEVTAPASAQVLLEELAEAFAASSERAAGAC